MTIAGFHQLELLFSKECDQYSIQSFHSPLDELFGHNLGSNRILTVRGPSDELYRPPQELELMEKTDLAKQLKVHGITHLLLDGPDSPQKQAWASQHGITLLVNDAQWQKRLEDKGEFHELLQSHGFLLPRGQMVSSLSEVRKLPFRSMVLQVPESRGGLGTRLLSDAADLGNVLQEGHLSFPLLAREWIPKGLPVGVTLIVGKTGTVISALRLQANAWDAHGTHTFFGIQWLPSGFCSALLLDRLSSELGRLGDVLRSEGFLGIANLDLILNGDQWYFIECNPRLSAATPSLCLLPELLHGLSFIDVYADALTGQKLPPNANCVPKTTYNGTTIVLDYIALTEEGKTIRRVPPVGCCVLKGNTFTSSSLNMKDALRPSSLFFYHDLHEGDEITRDGFIGFVLTHQPIAAIEGTTFALTESGRQLLEKAVASVVN